MLGEKTARSVRKLDLCLTNRKVLTEAAAGNYVVTPVIAAAAGADVIAFTRDSAYGSVGDVVEQTSTLAASLGLSDKVRIVTDLAKVDLCTFHVVTNCGFLRPLNRHLISQLSPGCVIPLMYEPWEFRDGEIDLNACRERGIKVYGTDEANRRLRTMEYIGYIALSLLLERKLSPFGTRVLVLGCRQFVAPIVSVLDRNGYAFHAVTDYREKVEPAEYDAIVVAEFANDRLIIGAHSSAYIGLREIRPETYVIHIAGNVDMAGAGFVFTPESPKPFRHMSYTADFVDPQAVIDLHAGGLKVAEGMLEANRLGLVGSVYKEFMERNYPALAFSDNRLW